MKSVRARLFRKKTSSDEIVVGTGPVRVSTFDSLDGQLQSLGLEASTSSQHGQSSQPPPYNENVEPGSTVLEAGAPALHRKGDMDVIEEQPPHTHNYSLSDVKQIALLAEEQLLDQATAFIHESTHDPDSQVAPAPLGPFPPLTQPIFIPRVNPGPTMPFTRAWAPVLAAYDISQSDFLAFIDNLNLVCAPHAAIKMVELAAIGIGHVPVDWAEGLSGGLRLLAMATTAAVAHARRKRYLARANEGLFHPRGLHTRVVGTRKMGALLDLAKDDPLIVPLSETTIGLSVQDRCLLHLESKGAAPLMVAGLPGPGPQTKLLAKLAAWQVRSQTNKFEKMAAKSRKKAWKRAAKGKKLKEMGLERIRVKWLSWIVVQSLEDYEREVREEAEKKAQKKARRKEKSEKH